MKIEKYKRESDFSYALGATLTYEILKNCPQFAKKVFISSHIEQTDAVKDMLRMCKENGIEVEENDKAFNVLSPKGNCFVICQFEKFNTKISKGCHVVLVNPADAGNLGTILRTSTGFGLKNIAIIKPAVDVFDPKTIRASMGAIFHVNVEYFDTFEEYKNRFKENNLYAFMLTSSQSIHSVEIKQPFSLIFGNEGSGLPDEYATMCKSVIIPHSNEIDSLNLPIASSIAMFHFTKDKWKK